MRSWARELFRQSSQAANATMSRRLQSSFSDLVIHSLVKGCLSTIANAITAFRSDISQMVYCDRQSPLLLGSSAALVCIWADISGRLGEGELPTEVTKRPPVV